MPSSFNIQPIGRFAGASQPVKRPKEFTCFSYDETGQYHPDASSMKWYYPPQLGADLSRGYETFEKADDSKDGHLDSLLKAIMLHEQETEKKIDVNLVTWRGMMTKIMAAPFDVQDGFEMNATFYQGCIFIEENHAFRMENNMKSDNRINRRGPPLEVMAFWGYKFETLSTLPAPWAETSREFIESRETQVVNNKAQYCTVVRTGIGRTTLCLGGEVDAIWDSKPEEKGKPINWVELKTTAELNHPNAVQAFHRKLMKYWIQSFLVDVPRIVVGFRTREGVLASVDGIETQRIPEIVNSKPNPSWNADMCVNFAAEFLDWLKSVVNDEGLWRIRRRKGDPLIEVYKMEETGHGDIISDDFKNWRIKLAMKGLDQAGPVQV